MENIYTCFFDCTLSDIPDEIGEKYGVYKDKVGSYGYEVRTYLRMTKSYDPHSLPNLHLDSETAQFLE